MHGATDGAELSERDESFRAIVSNLSSLAQHVRASIDLIETAIAREMMTGGEEPAHVIVLDDVTPRYLRAGAALNACGASLGGALQLLLDTGTPADDPAPASDGPWRNRS